MHCLPAVCGPAHTSLPMECILEQGQHVQGCHAAAHQGDCLCSSEWHLGRHSVLLSRGSQRRSCIQQLDGQRLQSATYDPPCQMCSGPSALHCAQQNPQVGRDRQLVHPHKPLASFAVGAWVPFNGAWPACSCKGRLVPVSCQAHFQQVGKSFVIAANDAESAQREV